MDSAGLKPIREQTIVEELWRRLTPALFVRIKTVRQFKNSMPESPLYFTHSSSSYAHGQLGTPSCAVSKALRRFGAAVGDVNDPAVVACPKYLCPSEVETCTLLSVRGHLSCKRRRQGNRMLDQLHVHRGFWLFELGYEWQPRIPVRTAARNRHSFCSFVGRSCTKFQRNIRVCGELAAC